MPCTYITSRGDFSHFSVGGERIQDTEDTGDENFEYKTMRFFKKRFSSRRNQMSPATVENPIEESPESPSPSLPTPRQGREMERNFSLDEIFWRRGRINSSQKSFKPEGDKAQTRVDRFLDEPFITTKLNSSAANLHPSIHQRFMDSIKPTSSSLTAVHSMDGVRNRSCLASVDMLGSEELERHLPGRSLKLCIVTWNMEGKKEFPDSLEELLLPGDMDFPQDLYVVGVQERGRNRLEWEIGLQKTLGPRYVMLHSAAHGVLHISIFIRRELIWVCSEVEIARVTTRIVSQIKTKGALAMSVTLFGTSFLFINSHFRAGDKHIKKRERDYKKIIKSLQLKRNPPDTDPSGTNSSDVTSRFDEVFWFGDFNYRVNKPRGEVDSILQQNPDYDMSQLLQHDQLIQERNDGHVFTGFKEGEINFPPTYKFDIGTDVYDTSWKQRTPSYTDRVMYKSRQAGDITVLRYSSCPAMRMSDHKPVFGVFDVRVRPGGDNFALAPGQFNSQVYTEALKRRGSWI